MSQYETTTITPDEQQTGLTTEESYNNIDPSSPNYQGAGPKKPSMLGKLKDKTKKAGSKIKSKVGKKKATGGGATGMPTGGEEEEDEESTSDNSPSPVDASSPAVHATPYTGPASVPREFGTFPSQGRSEPKDTEDTPPPDMSGLSLDDATTGSEQQPSAGEKAAEVSEGAKDAVYGGAAATAGALGVGAMDRDDHPDEKPVTEKASDASSDAAGRAEELGRGGYDRAGEAKDEVAEKGGEVADRTKDAAYETKDAAQSTAADVNNATGDSQTYTEKAVAAKDAVADKLGMNQPSEGPSVVDQAKGYLGSAVGATKEKTGMNQPSQGPSLMDQAKSYFGSAADTTKEKSGTGVDTTKDTATEAKDTTTDYAGSAYGQTADVAQGATDTTKEYATKAKESVADAATPEGEDKALSEKITDSLSGPTAPATTGAAKDETNPGILGKITGMFGYAPKDHPHDGKVSPSTATTPATQ